MTYWIVCASTIPPVVFGGIVKNAVTALQITIAPRVFLLERIAELVK